MSLPWIPAFRRKRAAGDNANLPISYHLMFCSISHRGAHRSPVDPVSAIRVPTEDARDLRDGSGNPQHDERTFVGPEPGGASRGTAHPVVVSKDRAVAFDIDFETAMIELAGVRVRRELQEDGERDDPLQETAEGREVNRLIPHHPTDRFVGSVAEPSLDLIEDLQRGAQRIPSVRMDETRVDAGLHEGLVRRGPAVVGRDPVVIVPKVAPANHGRDQPVSPGVGELAEHGDPEPRRSVQLPTALPADALRQIGAHELAQRAAHVREAKARPLGDLNRSLGARDDGREDLLALPAREDIRKPIEHVRGSRVQYLPRARCAETHDAAERPLPFPHPPGPRYVKRTGTRSEAIRCTRRTRNATGTRPTIAERPANPMPKGPVAAAKRSRTARRDNAAIRRGFELDQRRATPRPTRTAKGAAIAVARTADVTRRRSDAGAPQTVGHGERSPAKARTAAAAPLRSRWMMNSTATLRSAVDVETAPRTTMN